MEKEEIFQQIKNELTEKEQMVLASMLDGGTDKKRNSIFL